MASGLLEIEEARRSVLDAAGPLPGEPVELEGALGRALARDALATESVPGFDSSAMDGFAVRSRDVALASPDSPVRLRVLGESRAGLPARARLATGEAIAISTGAMVPQGADAIVRVEDTAVRDGHVEVLASAPAGWDVRRAGDDIRAGETVLEGGTLLGAAQLGVLASLGYTRVECARRPRVSVLVSGDELLSAGEPSRPGGVRDSNSLTISALVRESGAELLGAERMVDDAAASRTALSGAVRGADVAIVCGGVSVGAHDHVRPALAALGARQRFWGLALKPGSPTWFGALGSTLVFGLPGNPVSAMVTFILFVRPALRAMLGLPVRTPRATAAMASDYEKPAGRAHALRCRLSAREDGWHAQPTGPQGSHVLTSMLGADALAIVPAETTRVRAGERVEIELLGAFA